MFMGMMVTVRPRGSSKEQHTKPPTQGSARRAGARAAAPLLANKMNVALRKSIADQLKNTSLGFIRIKRNLSLIHFTDNETEKYLRKIILSTPLEDVETKGKNHYFKCLEYNAVLTVNAHTFTIITAKQIDKR